MRHRKRAIPWVRQLDPLWLSAFFQSAEFTQGQGLRIDVRLLEIRVDDDLVIVLPEFAAEKVKRMDVGCIASLREICHKLCDMMPRRTDVLFSTDMYKEA